MPALQVGKIKDVREAKDGQAKVQVAWFYRPEEAVGGRKVLEALLHVQLNKYGAVKICGVLIPTAAHAGVPRREGAVQVRPPRLVLC